MDIKAFFNSVTRSKVHRALRRIGFNQRDAVGISELSTVEDITTPGRYALPFGFIQSMILATAALDRSRLGKELRRARRYRVRISVYVDDIVLSGSNVADLAGYMAVLNEAADEAGYSFNKSKASGPAGATKAFNVLLSSNDMRISPDRMVEFELALATETEEVRIAVLNYIRTVNRGQADALL
jgi:hypothetical protein